MRNGLAWLPLAALLAAAGACGGSNDDSSGSGGKATGGTTSSGGSSATGGTGGSSSGGTSAGGSAGSTTGGAAGTTSSGGAAGSPGTGGTGGAPIAPPVPDDCITDVSAKPDHVFDCSGLKFNVSVPAACVKFACGVVFDIHGLTMNGLMENNNTKLSELGDKYGYIVVHPNAPGSPPTSSWTAASDDPKVFDFMQRTIKAFHVDDKRVHFTGFSQGGDMSWRFICDHSDVIASAAPAAFTLSAQENCFSKGKAPPREMPMLYMHGTKDALVNFSGAITTRDTVIGILGMTQQAVVETDSSHIWTRYSDAKGTVFEFIQHDYTGAALIQGHCYPGSTDPGGVPGQLFSFKCDQTAAFNWGEAAMQFFLAHPFK